MILMSIDACWLLVSEIPAFIFFWIANGWSRRSLWSHSLRICDKPKRHLYLVLKLFHDIISWINRLLMVHRAYLIAASKLFTHVKSTQNWTVQCIQLKIETRGSKLSLSGHRRKIDHYLCIHSQAYRLKNNLNTSRLMFCDKEFQTFKILTKL
jgi:hypothetical protein